MDALVDAGPGVRSRELGPQEQYLSELHGYGGLIAVNTMHIRGPLTAALVRRGLDWLQRRHPMLRAHIRYGAPRLRKELPFLVRRRSFHLDGTTEIPLSVLPAGTDWRRLMQKELKTPLGRGRNPRMRAILIEPGPDGVGHFVTTTDHTIADAPAGMMLSRQLLEFFADPDQEIPLAAGLPPALETNLPPKPGSPSRPYEAAIRLPHKVNWRAPRETHGVVRTFSAAETAAIGDATRRNRSTIHGTVSAALLEAIHRQYGLAEMTSLSTIELRRMCRPPLPADTFGCYIDILRTRHALGGPFWELARDVAYKLITTVAKEQANASILKPLSWGVYRAEWRGLTRSGFRLDGMGMTSAGKVDLIRKAGDFEVVDTDMLMSMHVLGPGFFAVNFESEGCLSLALMYASHVLDAAEAGALADAAAARLRNLPEA